MLEITLTISTSLSIKILDIVLLQAVTYGIVLYGKPFLQKSPI